MLKLARWFTIHGLHVILELARWFTTHGAALYVVLGWLDQHTAEPTHAPRHGRRSVATEGAAG